MRRLLVVPSRPVAAVLAPVRRQVVAGHGAAAAAQAPGYCGSSAASSSRIGFERRQCSGAHAGDGAAPSTVDQQVPLPPAEAPRLHVVRSAPASPAGAAFGRRVIRSSTQQQAKRHAAGVAGPQPLLLVLDLDETLVRVCCDGVHNRTRRLGKVDFRIHVNVGTPPKVQTFDCGVAIRPGLEQFIDWIKDRRKSGLIADPWIFTTSTREYTQALLAKLDPLEEVFSFQRALPREKCTPSRLPGFYLKDLSQVPSEDECQKIAASRKVLVDNSPVSCVLNYDASILVRDWLGEDTTDTELERVQDLVDGLIIDARTEGDGSYTEALARSTPGHSRFRERLQGLQKQLSVEAPRDIETLRQLMKAAQNECLDMKRELLGDAP